MANTNPIVANTPYIYSVCAMEEEGSKGITGEPLGITGVAKGITGVSKGINVIAKGITGVSKGINVIAKGITGVSKGINVIAKGISGVSKGINVIAKGITGMKKVSRFTDGKLNNKIIVVSLNFKNAMPKVKIQMFSENIFCIVKGLITIVQI